MTKLTRVRLDALARIPYLRNLPPAARESLAAVCELRSLRAGARAFSEGDAPDGVFLVVSGRLKLVRSSADGREQVLHEEGAGATLAEVPSFDGGGYVASAIAVEDSVVFLVPRTPLLAALDRSPDSSLEVIRILAARVRRFAALVEDLSLRAVTARLAGYLLRESERSATGLVMLPSTREQLAAHVGTVREQVSRGLTELKKTGAIEVDRRRVRVRNPRQLARLAGRH